jgi:putative hydrolase of HD superfamily
MSELDKFRIIYKLDSIYRFASVDDRHESTAEHTWSTLILADYILNSSDKQALKIDRLKVYELLMYHDLVEIYSGDTPLDPKNKSDKVTNQIKRENIAFKRLVKELPEALTNKYKLLRDEYENMKTVESRFAKAIDKLDACLHEMDYKKDWIGWSEKFLRDKTSEYFTEFPLIMEIFEEFLKYANENGFFNQE